jgi:hypothetical protein
VFRLVRTFFEVLVSFDMAGSFCSGSHFKSLWVEIRVMFEVVWYMEVILVPDVLFGASWNC